MIRGGAPFRRAVLALGALLAVMLGTGCARDPEPLTIVLVSLDTTRLDHLSAYDAPRDTTPVLARLAREGTVFTQARSTSSWTLPAHVSLFTGLPPALHDVDIDFQVMDRSLPTLGRIFRNAGFRTLGVYSAPYVHPHFGFGRGFDFYERGTQDPMFFDLTPQQRQTQLGLREQRSHTEVTSQMVVDRGLRLLANSRSPRNLLFLHLFDPHYDYLPPPRLARRFTDPGYAGPVTGKGLMSQPEVLHAGMPPADLRQLRDLYDAELAWTDENLGRLLDGLQAQGRLQHTLVVVTSDHGEEFFERGRFGHRAGLHDEVLRVPLLFWWPGRVAADHVVTDDVSIVDVLPTLMDLAGLPADAGIHGRSLRAALEGGSLAPRPALASLSFFPQPSQGHYVRHRAMVVEGLKVLEEVQVEWHPERQEDLRGALLESTRRLAVFDLRADPVEQHDLLAVPPGQRDERVQRAVEAFEDEWTRQQEQAALRQRDPSDAGLGDIPLTELLIQLGYLDHGQHAPRGPAVSAPVAPPVAPEAPPDQP